MGSPFSAGGRKVPGRRGKAWRVRHRRLSGLVLPLLSHMATPKCKGIWEITLATQQRGKMSLGKEVTPEAQGMCADAGRTPMSAAARPCFHPCAHELRSEPGLTYVRTRLFGVRFADAHSRARTHRGPEAGPQRGVSLHMCAQVPPSLTLNPPWCSPLLGWCFRVGRAPAFRSWRSYTGRSLLEKVSEG